ncbi:MAG: hypothetical protein GY749_20585 [Desulfobacteraceae bacterium]|nr:hypothetical protein [Desulfobacteraceae bacterium]
MLCKNTVREQDKKTFAACWGKIKVSDENNNYFANSLGRLLGKILFENQYDTDRRKKFSIFFKKIMQEFKNAGFDSALTETYQGFISQLLKFDKNSFLLKDKISKQDFQEGGKYRALETDMKKLEGFLNIIINPVNKLNQQTKPEKIHNQSMLKLENNITEKLNKQIKQWNFTSLAITVSINCIVIFIIFISILLYSKNRKKYVFAITEKSLVKLKKDGVPKDIIAKLRKIKNKRYRGANEFVDALETKIGDNQTDEYESLIMKYARFKKGGIMPVQSEETFNRYNFEIIFSRGKPPTDILDELFLQLSIFYKEWIPNILTKAHQKENEPIHLDKYQLSFGLTEQYLNRLKDEIVYKNVINELQGSDLETDMASEHYLGARLANPADLDSIQTEQDDGQLPHIKNKIDETTDKIKQSSGYIDDEIDNQENLTDLNEDTNTTEGVTDSVNQKFEQILQKMEKLTSDIAELKKKIPSEVASAIIKTEQKLLLDKWRNFRTDNQNLIELAKSIQKSDTKAFFLEAAGKLPELLAEHKDLASQCNEIMPLLKDYYVPLISLAKLSKDLSKTGDGMENEEMKPEKELILIRNRQQLLDNLSNTKEQKRIICWKPEKWIREHFLRFADSFLIRYQDAVFHGKGDTLEEPYDIVVSILAKGELEPVHVVLGETFFNSEIFVARSKTTDTSLTDGTIAAVVRNGFRQFDGKVIQSPEVIVNRL